MKKNRNIVFILFGIALIIFSFHAQTFNAGSYNFLESALIYLIYCSKYIGLIFCFAGLFYKEK